MKRYRERRVQEDGFQRGMVHERVIELANDAKPPDGAEPVADTEDLYDWRPQAPQPVTLPTAPQAGG